MLVSKGSNLQVTKKQVKVEVYLCEDYGRNRGALQVLNYPEQGKTKFVWLRYATLEEKAQGDKATVNYFTWLNDELGVMLGAFVSAHTQMTNDGNVHFVKAVFDNGFVRVDIEKERVYVRVDEETHVASIALLTPETKANSDYHPWRKVRVKTNS